MHLYEALKGISLEFIIKAYAMIEQLEVVDPAHGFEHVSAVTIRAYQFAEQKGLDPTVAALAAWYHDVGNVHDRDTHHEVSAWILMRMIKELKPNPYLWRKAPKDLKAAVLGVLEHRASFKGDRTPYGTVVAMADRGKPSAKHYFLRSYQYHTGKFNRGHEVALKEAIAHMHDKYGVNGYVYDKDMLEFYPEECQQLKSFVVNAKEEDFIRFLN